jgi:urea transport system permease protein
VIPFPVQRILAQVARCRWRLALLCVVAGLTALRPVVVRAELANPAIKELASEEFEQRAAAIERLVATAEPRVALILKALIDGDLLASAEGFVYLNEGGQLVDAATGAAVPKPAAEPEVILANNALRQQAESALAALRLFAPDPEVRRAAVREFISQIAQVDAAMLPMLDRAMAAERDPEVRDALRIVQAVAAAGSPQAERRLEAVRVLGSTQLPAIRTLLAKMAGEGGDEDRRIRGAAAASLALVETRLSRGEWLGRIFAGLSLGSILMLAAIGLAITYGLLGVINMAHGEMIMIGAYATWGVQSAFRAWAPQAFDWYPLVALPAAFLAAGLLGVLLERGVIRHLYGRPLETLLATWGISLALIQAVRTLVGPQNVEIQNPTWLSGAVSIAGATLPWNRIVIIGFSLAVLLLIALLLSRTRLGLFVRGVTQNRAMASAIGVPIDRVDLLAFGLGSGVAGLAGVALSQIGNVGPDLGQSFVIDSFMVVVLGGVGQLAGTVFAGFGLGLASKFLEPSVGAVIAKILILVGIIAFIQKRPQGLFALRGRALES